MNLAAGKVCYPHAWRLLCIQFSLLSIKSYVTTSSLHSLFNRYKPNQPSKCIITPIYLPSPSNFIYRGVEWSDGAKNDHKNTNNDDDDNVDDNCL